MGSPGEVSGAWRTLMLSERGGGWRRLGWVAVGVSALGLGGLGDATTTTTTTTTSSCKRNQMLDIPKETIYWGNLEERWMHLDDAGGSLLLLVLGGSLLRLATQLLGCSGVCGVAGGGGERKWRWSGDEAWPPGQGMSLTYAEVLRHSTLVVASTLRGCDRSRRRVVAGLGAGASGRVRRDLRGE